MSLEFISLHFTTRKMIKCVSTERKTWMSHTMVRDVQSYHVSEMKFGFSSCHCCCTRRRLRPETPSSLVFIDDSQWESENLLWIWMRFSDFFFRQMKFEHKSEMCFLEGSLFLICFYTIPPTRHVQMIQQNNIYSFLKQTTVVQDVVDEEKKGSFWTKLFKSNYRNTSRVGVGLMSESGWRNVLNANK